MNPAVSCQDEPWVPPRGSPSRPPLSKSRYLAGVQCHRRLYLEVHSSSKALRALRPGGRLVSFGATTGRTTEVDIRHVFWSQISILGTTMGSPREFAAMLHLYESGRLKPVADSVFPLRDAPAAHRRMDAGQQFGKIVLVP